MDLSGALSRRHSRILFTYLLNIDRGRHVVRGLITNDIARFTDMGADGYSSELREVLNSFDAMPWDYLGESGLELSRGT